MNMKKVREALDVITKKCDYEIGKHCIKEGTLFAWLEQCLNSDNGKTYVEGRINDILKGADKVGREYWCGTHIKVKRHLSPNDIIKLMYKCHTPSGKYRIWEDGEVTSNGKTVDNALRLTLDYTKLPVMKCGNEHGYACVTLTEALIIRLTMCAYLDAHRL